MFLRQEQELPIVPPHAIETLDDENPARTKGDGLGLRSR
jgi:hypothetical protein